MDQKKPNPQGMPTFDLKSAKWEVIRPGKLGLQNTRLYIILCAAEEGPPFHVHRKIEPSGDHTCFGAFMSLHAAKLCLLQTIPELIELGVDP